MNLFKFCEITSNDEINMSFKIRKKVFCEEQNISEDIEFDNLDHYQDTVKLIVENQDQK